MVNRRYWLDQVEPANLAVFARAYPRHELLVVTTDAHPALTREYTGRPVRFLTLDLLVQPSKSLVRTGF